MSDRLAKITFKTYFNPNDEELTAFRLRVCSENGGTEIFLNQAFSHRQVFEMLENEPPDSREEVYKFGKSKWENTSFHSIEGLMLDGELVSISACEKMSSDFMRIGMRLYTLKDYRKELRNHMFSDKGFFHRHLIQARNENIKAVYLTVYPHTERLRFHALNLGIYKRAPHTDPQPYLKDLKMLGEFPVQGVKQFVILYNLGNEDLSESLRSFLSGI